MAFFICSRRQRIASLVTVACFLLVGSVGCVGPCGPGACGPFGGGLLGMHQGCGSGCGDACDGCGSERYYDEWINHPPTADPCDCCGNFNGQSCGSCRPVFGGFLSIWGYRCNPLPTGCPTAGCDNLGGCGCEPTCGVMSCDPGCGSEMAGSCGSGCSSCGGGHSHSLPPGEVMLQSYSPSSGQGQIVRGTPAVKAYQPQRERQIFNARTPGVQRAGGMR